MYFSFNGFSYIFTIIYIINLSVIHIKTFFLPLTRDVSSRTRTSWRSCEVKPRRSATGWVAIGCPSPGPPWTSWRSSRRPRWTATSPTRTAQEEVRNGSVDQLRVSTHQRAFSLTPPPPFSTSQANPAALTDGRRSPGGTRSVSAPSTISSATSQPSNLPRSQSARCSNRFDTRSAVSIKRCRLEMQENMFFFFQGGLASCWSSCLDATVSHAFTSGGLFYPYYYIGHWLYRWLSVVMNITGQTLYVLIHAPPTPQKKSKTLNILLLFFYISELSSAPAKTCAFCATAHSRRRLRQVNSSPKGWNQSTWNAFIQIKVLCPLWHHKGGEWIFGWIGNFFTFTLFLEK